MTEQKLAVAKGISYDWDQSFPDRGTFFPKTGFQLTGGGAARRPEWLRLSGQWDHQLDERDNREGRASRRPH